MRCMVLLGALVVLIPTAGCGGGPKLVPVRGRVVLADGQPVTAASISFSPDKDKGNDSTLYPLGALQLDGSFALRTYPHGDGAVAGSYRVTISLGRRAQGSLAKYTRLKDTPLLVDIPPEGRTDLVFTLE
jgi:hypothetical protein